MKLSYNRKSKDPTYYVQKSYRKDGKPTTKSVCTIGKHSELLKITDDPLEYAKQYVRNLNDKEKSKVLKVNMSLDRTKKVSYPDDNPEADISVVIYGSNIGYLYLQGIYYQLNLQKFFEKVTANKKNLFDCNLINRFLTFARILDPKSKKGTCDCLKFFYEKPQFTHQQVLRFMDILVENKEEYIGHLYKESNKIIPRDTSVMYYDCTNYFFENEHPDIEVDEVTGELIRGLRQFGVSKEHRPNPIVEMGLIMDSRGIPISLCIHRGNESEQTTAIPLEKEIVKFIPKSKFIYCADAGLGSYNIRKFNSMGGRAFVVTQSIKNLSKRFQEAVFNDFDYRLLSTDREITLKELMEFDKDNPDNISLYNDKAYKVFNADNEKMWNGEYREITTKNGKTARRKVYTTLRQSIIVTFSRKMMEYQRNVRNRQIERAKNMLKNCDPEAIKKGPNDVRRFLKNTSKSKSVNILDTEKIKEEEKFDGFYAIATNLDDPVKDILEIAHKRYQIEDCFRIMKTNFDARPVYHRNTPRIEAHFLICYTALLITRLLQRKLDDQGTHLTTDQLINTMKNMIVVNEEDIYYRAIYSNSKALEALEKYAGYQFDSQYLMKSDFTKILRKIKRRPSYTTLKS